jgi:hypothetical protein
MYAWGMLHLFIIPHVQTQSNRVCNFHVNLLFLKLPRDYFLTRCLYITTAGVNCCVAAVKSCPVLYFSVVIFSGGPSGSLSQALFSVKNWVPLKSVQGGVRDVAPFYYPLCTESAIFMYFCCFECFRGRDHFFRYLFPNQSLLAV